MLSTTRAVAAVLGLMAGVAGAQAPLVPQLAKPGREPVRALSCPAGTVQAGGPDSAFEALVCLRASNGQRVFHGPYVAFWPNGVRQSEGQYQEGQRSGRWTFYDADGARIGVTEFKEGSYDGQRLELFASGAPKLEEFYVQGKRQGVQKTWDAEGRLTIAEFRDDRRIR